MLKKFTNSKIKVVLLNADNNIDVLINKVNALQASVNTIAEALKKMEKNKIAFGDWISEKEILEMPYVSISRSQLLKYRDEGKLRSSTLNGKQVFYRLADFKKLLDENEEKM